MTGYPDSAAHLTDELARVDLLVRAQVEWFRADIGATKPGDQWGLPSIAETEIDRYLALPFGVVEVPAVVQEHIEAAARALELIDATVDESAVPLRLPAFCARFGLDRRELDVLLLCLLSHVDSRRRRLFGYLLDNATASAPTVDLALRIVESSHRDGIFAASAPLIRHHLVDIGPAGELRIDPRIVGHLLGDDTVDDRLAGMLTVDEPFAGLDELVLAADHRDELRGLAGWLRSRPEGAVVFLHGPYGSGRRSIATALCADARLPMMLVDVRAALRGSWPLVVDLCHREALLRNAVVCWLGADRLLEDEHAEQWTTLVEAIDRFPGRTLITSSTPWDPAGVVSSGRFVRIDLAAPNFAQRQRLWLALLPPDAAFEPPRPRREHLADLLANTFQLTAGQLVDSIGSAIGVARLRDPAVPRLRADDLFEGCRRQSGRRLVAFARRIEPRTELGFDDLVLPDPNRRQLEELRARIGLRGKVYGELGFDRRLSLGRGVVAMFTGGSGTGKTMAAELLAREQGADLYKVDLSAVASKYVGETEKNLDRVFADAERSNAMVFFDEADALFAKRGEVKEARDRWANVEMAFLLQRVEEFRGVVVLASNLRQNIDTAFLRRLHAVVDFPAPDADARLRIWQGMFPAGMRYPDGDELAELAARFPMSGGSIKNIVLDAAFRALRSDPAASAVGVRDLVISVGREYQKLGLPVTPGEFGRPFYGWVERELLAGNGGW
ncbi:ATP-binding protein [Kutzneria sp. CA-103260]|uniref:ATP-binding protein n=1 Tax=Kutzneria sp. CA-103260 TaxID=2802641 RepID=UPI001BAC7780|nr:ATP-binding protein [Kutzneria sp. CA-103260]QUQ65626.1 ATP-binding protein [Kutzneria sp. CA-103260]